MAIPNVSTFIILTWVGPTLGQVGPGFRAREPRAHGPEPGQSKPGEVALSIFPINPVLGEGRCGGHPTPSHPSSRRRTME